MGLCLPVILCKAYLFLRRNVFKLKCWTVENSEFKEFFLEIPTLKMFENLNIVGISNNFQF